MKAPLSSPRFSRASASTCRRAAACAFIGTRSGGVCAAAARQKAARAANRSLFILRWWRARGWRSVRQPSPVAERHAQADRGLLVVVVDQGLAIAGGDLQVQPRRDRRVAASPSRAARSRGWERLLACGAAEAK